MLKGMARGRKTLKITLDNNCLISLDNDDEDSSIIRQIVGLQTSKKAQVFVPAIAASENKQGNKQYANFREFEEFLRKIGCDDCHALDPLAYADVTYLNHCVLDPSELEEPIHRILFPRIPFKYADYRRFCGIVPNENVLDRKWRNAKCDVLAMWCHIHYGNDAFITNDRNFHKVTKKPRLIGLGAKEILRPREVLNKFLYNHSTY